MEYSKADSTVFRCIAGILKKCRTGSNLRKCEGYYQSKIGGYSRAALIPEKFFEAFPKSSPSLFKIGVSIIAFTN